jgi:hypothetical protein
MPGIPTEHIADDLGELRESHRQLATEFRESNRQVLEAVRDIGRKADENHREFVGFRSEVKNDLRWIKGIGAFFAVVLASMVAGSVTVAWNASAVVSEVTQPGKRLDKIEQRLDGFDAKFDALPRRGAGTPTPTPKPAD